MRSESSPAQIDATLSQRAYELLESYLIEDAKFAVNLPAKSRERACHSIEAYGSSGYSLPTLKDLISSLDITKREIFSLMESDSFFRFLKSPIYEKYKESMVKKSEAKVLDSQQSKSHSMPTSLPESLTLIINEEKRELLEVSHSSPNQHSKSDNSNRIGRNLSDLTSLSNVIKITEIEGEEEQPEQQPEEGKMIIDHPVPSLELANVS